MATDKGSGKLGFDSRREQQNFCSSLSEFTHPPVQWIGESGGGRGLKRSVCAVKIFFYIWCRKLRLGLYHSYCTFMYLHRANWHSSATLTEVCPGFFLSFKASAKVKTRKDRARPALFQIAVLFYVLLILCLSVYCLCSNVYCTTATGWLSNCS